MRWLPAAKRESVDFGSYEHSFSNTGGDLKLRRRVEVEGFYFGKAMYRTLRSFFGEVNVGDEEHIVLQAK